MPLAGIVLVFGVYLPRFYVGLGNGFVAVAGAIAMVRFIDIWLDPFLGVAMDRTRTPLGRYRPWLLLGAPVAMLGVYELMNPPPHARPGHLVIWMLVTYAGVSMLNLSLAAWASVLAGRYHERSRVYGVTQGLAVVGAVALMLLPALTHGRLVLGQGGEHAGRGLDHRRAIPITALICAAATPERIVPQRPRGLQLDATLARVAARPTMLRIVVADLVLTLGPGTTAPLYVYFFHDAKGFNIAEVGFLLIFYIGAGLVGAPFWGRVARRFGKHRTVQIACVVLRGSAQTVLMALPRVWPHHQLADMAPTVVRHVRRRLLRQRLPAADPRHGRRRGRRGAAGHGAGPDQPALHPGDHHHQDRHGHHRGDRLPDPQAGRLQRQGGRGEHAHAIFGLEMCYLFAPIILVFVGGAMFFGYKLDADRHAEIRTALAEADARSGGRADRERAGRSRRSGGADLEAARERPSHGRKSARDPGVRSGGGGGAALVPALAQLDVQRDLAQQRHAQPLGLAPSRRPRRRSGSRAPAASANQAMFSTTPRIGTGGFLAEHGGRPARIDQGDLLRRRDDHHPVELQPLDQRQLDVAGARAAGR